MFSISLSWQLSGGPITSLKIERSQGGAYTVIASNLPTSTTSYTDTGLAASTYSYRVTASGPGGTSEVISETVTVQYPAPIVSNLTASMV